VVITIWWSGWKSKGYHDDDVNFINNIVNVRLRRNVNISQSSKVFIKCVKSSSYYDL